MSQVGHLFHIQEYYCPPSEVIHDEVIRRGSFNLIHQRTGIKVDINLLKNSAFAESEFHRRKKVKLMPGLEVYIASAEDVIIKKLDYYREGHSEKHLTDIQSILMETIIDETYLNQWILKLGLSDEWAKTK